MEYDCIVTTELLIKVFLIYYAKKLKYLIPKLQNKKL